MVREVVSKVSNALTGSSRMRLEYNSLRLSVIFNRIISEG